jgi:hypothetical protein
VLSTKELREARSHIHKLLDPIWLSGRINRKEAYAYISKELGYTYHTGEIRSVIDARKVYRIIQQLKRTLEATI